MRHEIPAIEQLFLNPKDVNIETRRFCRVSQDIFKISTKCLEVI